MPEIFMVNWFRKDEDGKIIWPGFGENSRVLKWITERIEGKVEAAESVMGNVARAEDIDLTGLDIDKADVEAVLEVDPADWARGIEGNSEYLQWLGSRVPQEILDEFEAFKERVENA